MKRMLTLLFRFHGFDRAQIILGTFSGLLISMLLMSMAKPSIQALQMLDLRQ
jgi:hypothetical protein